MLSMIHSAKSFSCKTKSLVSLDLIEKRNFSRKSKCVCVWNLMIRRKENSYSE